MAKADRILDLFPAFYRASDRTKLLSEIVRNLAAPLEEADTLLFRIQRAHRINVAEDATDIVRLAAILNLDAFHFEDLLNAGDLAYEAKLRLMRDRVQRIARLHLNGLGTPWAVMEATAIFLNASIVPERPGDGLVKHVDPGQFSHKVVVEFSHLEKKPREEVFLHEIPLRRQKVEPVDRWPMNSWLIENHNVELSPVRLTIQGVGERTVRPGIFCPDTREGIAFDGIVPDGKTLVLDTKEGATLDKEAVDEWVIYYRGAIADFSSFDGSDFIVEDGGTGVPFDGDLQSVSSPPFRIKRAVPQARIGQSQWYFSVAQGVYDASDFDYSSYVIPAGPIGEYDGDFHFDQCLFDFPPSGIVGMAWDERVTCAFKLLLPARIPGAQQNVNYLGRVGSILPRFKAAGIHAYVDTGKDAWVLGKSILRDGAAASGDGVEFHATRLIDSRVEMMVS